MVFLFHFSATLPAPPAPSRCLPCAPTPSLFRFVASGIQIITAFLSVSSSKLSVVPATPRKTSSIQLRSTLPKSKNSFARIQGNGFGYIAAGKPAHPGNRVCIRVYSGDVWGSSELLALEISAGCPDYATSVLRVAHASRVLAIADFSRKLFRRNAHVTACGAIRGASDSRYVAHVSPRQEPLPLPLRSELDANGRSGRGLRCCRQTRSLTLARRLAQRRRAARCAHPESYRSWRRRRT